MVQFFRDLGWKITKLVWPLGRVSFYMWWKKKLKYQANGCVKLGLIGFQSFRHDQHNALGANKSTAVKIRNRHTHKKNKTN